ncbi:MAG: hypothetical protein ACOC55_01925 [Candidatus Natronoplasma sp.]
MTKPDTTHKLKDAPGGKQNEMDESLRDVLLEKGYWWEVPRKRAILIAVGEMDGDK